MGMDDTVQQDFGLLPSRILHIKELTFILPNDFKGGLDEALEEFMKYRKSASKERIKFLDEHGLFSTTELLMSNQMADANQRARVCGSYGIFELINGVYTMVEGTDPMKVPSREPKHPKSVRKKK